MSVRSNKIFLYVGNRDTGKTSWIKNLIDTMPQPKKLVVDTFDSPVWRNMKTWNHPEWESREIPIIKPEDVKRHQHGLCRVFDSDTDRMQAILSQDCTNTAVIMEDASRYFELNLTKSQRNYMLNSKQKNVDLHLIFHFLTDIPPRLVKMADYITLFKTGEFEFNPKKYTHPDFYRAFKQVANDKNRFANISLKLQ